MLPPLAVNLLIGIMVLAGGALIALTVWKSVRRRRAARAEPTAIPAVKVPVARESAAGMTAAETPRRSWEERRLFEPEEEQSRFPRPEPDEVPLADDRDYVIGSATPLLSEMMPESEPRRKQWKHDLQTAGYLSPRAFQNFSALRYLFIIVPMILFGLMLLVVPTEWEMPVLIALFFMPLIGWALPALYVRSRMTHRKAAIERTMPDFVDMLNMCVSQGLTLLSSLNRIRRQLRNSAPELTQELDIVIEQAEVGTLRQALENFARRVNVPEVQSLTNLLVQTDRMGTSVSVALREYSDSLRESLRQRADEKANRASFRLLFPTVLCLMPAVYLILMGPAMNELNRFFWSEGGGRTLIEQSREGLESLSR